MRSDDLKHLRRCVELAAEAAERGDDPFGSVLVSGNGGVLAERSNTIVTASDVTAHPELHLALWTSVRLSSAQRRNATMYTSGEHCPMCAAAHIWVGIGRLVYVLSAQQIKEVSSEPKIDLTVREMVDRSSADIVVEGPCDELVDEAQALFG